MVCIQKRIAKNPKEESNPKVEATATEDEQQAGLSLIMLCMIRFEKAKDQLSQA
jgi:hypothetical protein